MKFLEVYSDLSEHGFNSFFFQNFSLFLGLFNAYNIAQVAPHKHWWKSIFFFLPEKLSSLKQCSD